MSLSADFTDVVSIIDTGSVSGALGTNRVTVDQDYSKSWADGTGVDQVNKRYSREHTIAASGTLNLDLAGSLTDEYGATVTFARVKKIKIVLTTTAASTIQVGGGSNPLAALTNAITLRPGGRLDLEAPDATGYVVTAGTGDILRIVNDSGAASVTVKVIILGCGT